MKELMNDSQLFPYSRHPDATLAKRTPLPSCVMAVARKKFPDPEGKYTGFLFRKDS